MKKTSFLALGAIALSCAFAISCASSPKTPEKAPEQPQAPAATPAPQPSVSAENKGTPELDALRAKAADLRKKAFDLGLKDVLPEDYAAADKAFADGSASYGKDNAASTASFTDAAARFQGVLDQGLPLLAASERKRAETQRDAAMKKGADGLFKPLAAQADADMDKHRASEKAADYETAIAGYRSSTQAYATLYRLCEANDTRSFIVSRDLAKWDTSNWNLAEAKYKASQDLFTSDGKASSDAADEAALRYGVARDTALSYYSADRKKASETERDRASGIKSEVAVKDEFAAAQALYDKAAGADASKDYETSAKAYDQAATAFAKAYAHAKVKMDAAKGELDSLDAAIAAKNANAQ